MTDTTRADRINEAIVASRMERVDSCEWASPAVREVLEEYAADLRRQIPLSVGLDRIRRALEADRAARAEATGEPAIRLVS